MENVGLALREIAADSSRQVTAIGFHLCNDAIKVWDGLDVIVTDAGLGFKRLDDYPEPSACRAKNYDCYWADSPLDFWHTLLVVGPGVGPYPEQPTRTLQLNSTFRHHYIGEEITTVLLPFVERLEALLVAQGMLA